MRAGVGESVSSLYRYKATGTLGIIQAEGLEWKEQSVEQSDRRQIAPFKE